LKNCNVQKNGDFKKARSTGGEICVDEIGRRGFMRKRIGDARITMIRATIRSVYSVVVSKIKAKYDAKTTVY
jgi:hypothetical protein